VQETHACKEDEKFWRSQWGNDVWFSNFSNRSAGVAILRGNFRGQVLSHEIDSLGRMVILHVNIDQKHYTLVNSYATNNRQLNGTFFKNIEIKLKQVITKFPLAKIVWGGDFNSVFDEDLDRWPSRSNATHCEIGNVCTRVGLVDIWRLKNPDKRIYTWSNKDYSIQSRIDFFLISNELEQYVQMVSIEPSVLTDHKGISLLINTHGPDESKLKRGYWKLNKKLLDNHTFKLMVSKLIDKHWSQAKKTNVYGEHWEIMKYKIRNLAISMGKSIVSVKRQKEYIVTKEIMRLSSKDNLNMQELIDLSSLQVQLDNIYQEKAEGAFIRSRYKWLENGEKNTRYFFNLEKRNGELTSINKLLINNTVTENGKKILYHSLLLTVLYKVCILPALCLLI